MTASFSNLSLAEPLARAVAEMGYESMTPIQAQAIPVVLTGHRGSSAVQPGSALTVQGIGAEVEAPEAATSS